MSPEFAVSFIVGVFGKRSANSEDDTLTASDITSNLVFGDDDLIDLSSIGHSSTAKMGFVLPNVSSATPSSPESGEGYLAYEVIATEDLVH